MTDEEVLEMPARRFWAMERQIPLLNAAEDLRRANIATATQGEKTYKELLEVNEKTLFSEMKIEVNLNPKRDENVGEKLAKAMGK